ncbi:MAG: hypothetical protein ACOC9T_00635 [Myxococcota bacterium]
MRATGRGWPGLAAVWAMGALGLLGLGCEEEGGERCTPGESVACACPEGKDGAQVCQEDGTFGACECSAAPEAEAEAQGEAVAVEEPELPPEEVIREAYLSAVHAYNRRDAEAYFASFTDPLECFFGKAGYPKSKLRNERGSHFDGDEQAPDSPGLWSSDIQVLDASSKRAVLVDWGVWHMGSGDLRQGVHEKIVVLRKVGDGWRIAAETNRAKQACVEAGILDDVPMPAEVAQCRKGNADCVAACKKELGSTCEDAECAACANRCRCEMAKCFGAGDGHPLCSVTLEAEAKPVSAGELWKELQATAECLVDPDEHPVLSLGGVLQVDADDPGEAACLTTDVMLTGADAAGWSCDAEARRCVYRLEGARGGAAYLFRVRKDGGRALVAKVDYSGAVPDEEPPRVRAALQRRPSVCAFHDAVVAKRRSLATPPFFTYDGTSEADAGPGKHCGSEGRARAKAAVDRFAGQALRCTSLWCTLAGPCMGNAVHELLGARAGRHLEARASFEALAGDLDQGLREKLSTQARNGTCPGRP